jgi:hypothetical protein
VVVQVFEDHKCPIPDPILPPNEGNNLNLQENMQLGIELEFGDENLQENMQLGIELEFDDENVPDNRSQYCLRVEENLRVLTSY